MDTINGISYKGVISSKRLEQFGKARTENLKRIERYRIEKEYQKLTDEEKKSANIMALWEFVKPKKLRISANIIIENIKSKRETNHA